MTPVNYPFKIKKIPSNKKPGKITFVANYDNLKYEREIARILARFGYNISFLKPIDRQGLKTPDCVIGGIIWEIKAPKKNRKETFIRDIRDATKQSKNLIVYVNCSNRAIRQVAIDIINFIRERHTKKIQRVLILDKERYCYFTRDDVL